MRTLVISDLHLGMRPHRDVLRLDAPLEALLEALAGVDRLVLLGDVVELARGRPARAMAVAELPLRAIGRRLGRDREVVLVAGNHDRALLRPWIRRTGSRLAIDSAVPLDATPALAALSSWLAPARVTARYPGLWLSDQVWATHGHYLNRHLVPASSVGLTRGLLGRLPSDAARPIDYERLDERRSSSFQEAVAGVVPTPLAGLADRVAGVARAATMPLGTRTLLRPELARVNASLLSAQMRHASIPAMTHVVQRLGVDADWVLFGHVHRLGPLPDDDPALWQGPDGKPRLVNTGSWLYEPVLVQGATPPHPYWPGGAVVLDGDAPPQPVGLLDDLPESALRRRPLRQ